MIGMHVTVIVDRPLGSVHPHYPNLSYSVNYGYVEGVFSADGEEQDAYVLGVDTPVECFRGKVIAIIRRKDDVEDKWVVAPDGVFFTSSEIRDAVRFQERYFCTEIRVIRPAQIKELPHILNIYDAARCFMISTGNPHQWVNGYPSATLLTADIAAGSLYVEETDERLNAAFAFVVGEDPTYGRIEDGEWISDAPYGTIHRLASDGTSPGVFARCVAFCSGRISHLRMDTHRDNVVMQRLAEKEGFDRCGIIYVADGSSRIAYEKVGS